MKKYLMFACAALALASCSKSDDLYDASRNRVTDTYNAAFTKYVGGNIASNQNWGFGDPAGARMFNFTRSQSAPACPDINVTDIQNYAADVLAKSTEITSSNAGYTYSGAWYNLPNWTNDYPKDQWIRDANYVINFKISGTWNGTIGRAGIGSVEIGETIFENVGGDDIVWDYNANRGFKKVYVPTTIYITDGGKWVLGSNDSQTTGTGTNGKGDCVIIVGDGGTLEVNGTLNLSNQTRLIVMPGGKLTGNGTVNVNNGNAAGEENYNGGTIDVAVFNNNFGKFYNYGKFLVNEYQGGAKESNFYNHALVAVDHFGSSANARIFNGCQFYVANDARIRNYEGINGSALIVGGLLMFSSSMDGTSTPTYVSLEEGALVKCGKLWNQGTSWSGPNNAADGGYAVLSVGEIVYLNWEQNAPETGGYFANNIYVQADSWDNVPEGNGIGGENAEAKFAKVKNATGNGNVTVVEKGNYEVIPADNDFVQGQAGCTPGFKIKKDDGGNTNPKIRIIAEDLSATEDTDFDFNDVVFDVEFTSETSAKITLQAAGGTLPLTVAGEEVHAKFGITDTKTMINTNADRILTDELKAQGYKAVNNKAPVSFDVNGIQKSNWGKDIAIKVQKDGAWYDIDATTGGPAAKICVKTNFVWANEKQSIKARYQQFTEWVRDPSVDWY